MVELVIALEESSQACATADTQQQQDQQQQRHQHNNHRQPTTTTTTVTSSTMLEPTSAASVMSPGFATTALRDLPSLGCSIQPNRSLPLRPAPPVPRRSSLCQITPLQQQEQRRVFSSSSDEDKPMSRGNNGKEANSKLKDYLTQPNSKEENSSTRNGDGQRCLEDIVVDAAKMVPPLRLKKLAAADHQQQQQQQIEDDKQQRNTSDDESKYCIVNEANGRIEMGGEKVIVEEPKSIEIVIPSIPELGIKETRTDMRVNVPPDTSNARPFIVNYVLARDGKFPTVLPLNVKLAGVTTKNVEANVVRSNSASSSKSEPIILASNLSPSPAASIGSADKLSVRSMPLLGQDDCNDEVQIIPLVGSPSIKTSVDISPSEKRRRWYIRREQLREKFRELRAQAIEMRTQIDTSRSVLPEDSTDRPKFQKIIDDCDARINDYSNKLRKLNEATSVDKFHAYCDEVGEEKVYDDVEVEKIDRRHSTMKDYSSGDSSGEKTRVELLGKMSPMSEPRRTPNGYYQTTVDRVTATYAVRSKQSNGVIASSSHPQQQQQQQPRRSYSSFSIDELSAAPRTNATRAPANSPREALVPGAWVESQPGTSAGSSSNAIDHDKRPLDLATKRPASRDELAKDDRRKRRRVSDVTITHWPAGFAQPQLIQQQQQQQHHHHQQQQQQQQREVFTLPHQPTRLYPYVPEATIWSPGGIIVQHRETPANLGERLARNLDYRALWHEKPVSSVILNERQQPLPAEYVLAVQRMHENALTPEQVKARDVAATKAKASMQQSQQLANKVINESKTPGLELLEQAAANVKNNKATEQQQQQQHQRIMSEQFQSLGMWVASGMKPLPSDKNDELRQSYYQQIASNAGIYKPMANALPAANYVSNGVAVRWPTNEAAAVAAASTRAALHQVVQQQAIPPQQNPATVVAGQTTERHQAYYPTASMALSYPHKFPLEFYQKAYPNPYQYAAPIAYSRLPVGALEATATITSQSRVPPLIPLGASPSNNVSNATSTQWETDKRAASSLTAATQQQQQHHFYSPPPLPTPAQSSDARYARRGSLADYNNPVLNAEQAARLREVYEQQRHYQQQQQTTAAEQVVRQQQQARASSGKPQAYAQPQQNTARNGSTTTSSTPTSHYNSTRPSSYTTKQQQQQQQQQQSNSSYERECPTPNLGEVNRSPSGIQSIRCSNCGAPNSRFECLGCETTFYCNEACQVQHWSVHGTQCPKIMPRLKKLA